MKNANAVSNFVARIGASRTAQVAAGVGAVAVAPSAHATTSLGTLASGWTAQTQSVGKFLVEAFFMGGIGLTGFGLWTLYQASKPQTQATYKSAFTQLGVGGGLCAVASITGVAIGGIFNGGSGDGAPSIQQPTFSS